MSRSFPNKGSWEKQRYCLRQLSMTLGSPKKPLGWSSMKKWSPPYARAEQLQIFFCHFDSDSLALQAFHGIVGIFATRLNINEEIVFPPYQPLSRGWQVLDIWRIAYCRPYFLGQSHEPAWWQWLTRPAHDGLPVFDLLTHFAFFKAEPPLP